MTASIDINAWHEVPGRVAKLLPEAAKVRVAHEKAALAANILPLVVATWEPETGSVYVYADKPVSEKAARTYCDAFELPTQSIIFPKDLNRADAAAEILIKQGSFAVPGVKQVWNLSNKATLGPTPMTNGIVSALLLSGLGYGAGTLAENLFPDRHRERGKLRRRLGLAGALGGAGIGALNAYATSRALKQPYLKSLVTSNNTPVVYPFEKESYTVGYGYNPADPMVPDAIGINQPSINVPQFNTLMWRDVHKGMINPYGPYGSHTPPPIAAAATGMTSGLSAGLGSSIIRPADMVQGFVAAGMSPQSANLAGRTLGALASLSPASQYHLQNMGLWGGMVTAVVPPMFTGRQF
jgi:hypothetical protein